MRTKKTNEFDNILDECLERLISGETIDRCLADYPQYALQIEPLLRTAQVAREATEILPRPDFKARARYEFRAALHDEMAGKKSRSAFSMKRGWVTALMVISILFVASGGTALAANNSMPDSPLYPVKLVAEQVQMTLTPSTLGKAELCTNFVERRVDEIIYMAAKGDAQQIKAVTMHLDEDLTTLAMLVDPSGGDAAWSEAAVPEAAMPEAAPRADSEPAMLAVPTSPTPPQEPSETGQANGGKTEAAQTSPSDVVKEVPPPVIDILPEDDEAVTDTPVGNHNRANLRVTVANMAVTHQNALLDVLENSPASVKSALYQAIEVSQNGYRNALDNLD